MPPENTSTTDSTDNPEGTPPEGEQQTPEGQEPEGNGEGEGADNAPKPEDELPEWAKTERTNLRAEAANYRVKMREAQEALSNAKTVEEFQAATEQLNSRIAELERTLLVTKVATGLPTEQASILSALAEAGKTEAELTAFAETLRKALPAEEDPNPQHLGGGLNPVDDDPDDDSDPAAMARKYRRRR